MAQRLRHTPRPATMQTAIYVISLAALLLVTFYNLGANAIEDFDEARHAVNAYEMMRNGDCLVNTYMGETDLWNLKPPLGYWTVMLGYALFGYTSFGLRVVSAACWIATAFVLARWLRKHTGLPSSICFILLMVASTRLYEAHLVRTGDADAIFILLCVLELLFLIQARDSKWMVLPAGICVGLAFLAKSWHAFWMFPSTLLFLIVSGMLPRFSARHVVGYFLGSFAPIAVWAAARYAVDGSVFFKTMVEYDLLARSSTTLEEHYGGPEYYIKVLLLTPSAVASGLILIGACLTALKGKTKQAIIESTRSESTRFVLAVLAWTIAPIVLFSLVSTKLVWYVFPCVPVLCFIAAYVAPGVWDQAIRSIENRKSLVNLAPAALLAVVGAFTIFGIFVSCRNALTAQVNAEQDLLEAAYDGGDLPQGAEFYYWDGFGEFAPQGVVARAETSGDAYPLPGGVGAFAATDSPAALLVRADAANEPASTLPPDARLVGKTDEFLLYKNAR